MATSARNSQILPPQPSERTALLAPQRQPTARQPSPPHQPHTPNSATTARNNNTPTSVSSTSSAPSPPSSTSSSSRLSLPPTGPSARPSSSQSLLHPPPPSTLHHSVSDSATLSSQYHSTAHHIAHSPLPQPQPPPSDSEWEECVVLRDGKRYPVAQHEKHITTAALFLIVYFCVTGGPYGLEDGVRVGSGGGEGGVGWVMVLMLLLPLTIHMPIALMTGELASSMPQNGGYILWVSRAFGNFWSVPTAHTTTLHTHNTPRRCAHSTYTSNASTNRVLTVLLPTVCRLVLR